MSTRDLLVMGMIACLFLSFTIMADQFINWDTWWTWTDFLHHENFAVILVAFSAGLAVAFYLAIKQRQRR